MSKSSDGLNGVRAKLGRAEELLNAVDAEFARFVQGYSDPVIVRRDPDQLTDRFFWNIPDPPPARISLLAGDAIHNARASLDYIVWALSRQPIPRNELHWIAFPICTSSDCWINAESRNLKYLDPEPVAVIKGVQPYIGTPTVIPPYGKGQVLIQDATKYNPLVILNEWEKIDKHRNLHTVFAIILGGIPKFDFEGRFEVLYPQAVEHGTEIANITYPVPPPHSEMDVHIEFPGDVRIGEEPPTWGIRVTISVICSFIRNSIIAPLEPFF